jgi:hypothetical protein
VSVSPGLISSNLTQRKHCPPAFQVPPSLPNHHGHTQRACIPRKYRVLYSSQITDNYSTLTCTVVCTPLHSQERSPTTTRLLGKRTSTTASSGESCTQSSSAFSNLVTQLFAFKDGAVVWVTPILFVLSKLLRILVSKMTRGCLR